MAMTATDVLEMGKRVARDFRRQMIGPAVYAVISLMRYNGGSLDLPAVISEELRAPLEASGYICDIRNPFRLCFASYNRSISIEGTDDAHIDEISRECHTLLRALNIAEDSVLVAPSTTPYWEAAIEAQLIDANVYRETERTPFVLLPARAFRDGFTEYCRRAGWKVATPGVSTEFHEERWYYFQPQSAEETEKKKKETPPTE